MFWSSVCLYCFSYVIHCEKRISHLSDNLINIFLFIHRDEIVHESGVLQLNPETKGVYSGNPYPFGIDPVIRNNYLSIHRKREIRSEMVGTPISKEEVSKDRAPQKVFKSQDNYLHCLFFLLQICKQLNCRK